MLAKTLQMLAVSGVAFSLVLLAFSGLSTSIAQISTDSPDNLSGTVNSIVQDSDGTEHVIGGEWTLSLDGDKVSDFTVDLEMVDADGTGAHTHKIVLASEQTGIASAGQVTVDLVPTEQGVGGTVLVNASGLANKSDVTVKANNLIAGTPQSDADGNLLYALGISEDMIGSVTVSVEDADGNSGSSTMTIAETEQATGANQTLTPGELSSQGNLTGTQANATVQTSGNALLSGNASITTNQSSVGQAGNYSTALSNNTSSTLSTTGSEGSNLTSSGQATTATGENTTNVGNLTSSTESNAMATGTLTENATPTLSESAITVQTNGNTRTFKAVVDIYSGDEIAWSNVDITVSITNNAVMTIQIDPEATENHFGQEPIYGLVATGLQ